MNVYSNRSSNDWSGNSIEYMVKKKTNSSAILKRIIIVLCALVLAVAGWIIVSRFLPAIGAVLILLIAYFVKVFWDKTRLEYEYCIIQGEFTMDVIIGAKKRKTIANVVLRNAESVFPYKNNAPSDAILTDASSSPMAFDTWCIVYKDDKGVKQALLFSAINKALDIMAYYNKSAVSDERIAE